MTSTFAQVQLAGRQLVIRSGVGSRDSFGWYLYPSPTRTRARAHHGGGRAMSVGEPSSADVKCPTCVRATLCIFYFNHLFAIFLNWHRFFLLEPVSRNIITTSACRLSCSRRLPAPSNRPATEADDAPGQYRGRVDDVLSPSDTWHRFIRLHLEKSCFTLPTANSCIGRRLVSSVFCCLNGGHFLTLIVVLLSSHCSLGDYLPFPFPFSFLFFSLHLISFRLSYLVVGPHLLYPVCQTLFLVPCITKDHLDRPHPARTLYTLLFLLFWTPSFPSSTEATSRSETLLYPPRQHGPHHSLSLKPCLLIPPFLLTTRQYAQAHAHSEWSSGLSPSHRRVHGPVCRLRPNPDVHERQQLLRHDLVHVGRRADAPGPPPALAADGAGLVRRIRGRVGAGRHPAAVAPPELRRLDLPG